MAQEHIAYLCFKKCDHKDLNCLRPSNGAIEGIEVLCKNFRKESSFWRFCGVHRRPQSNPQQCLFYPNSRFCTKFIRYFCCKHAWNRSTMASRPQLAISRMLAVQARPYPKAHSWNPHCFELFDTLRKCGKPIAIWPVHLAIPPIPFTLVK